MVSPQHLTFSIPETAAALGIAPSTAYAAVKDGTFPVPVIKIGSRYVVPKKALTELLGVTSEEVG